MKPQWLNWVQQLQAIAQNGLAYSPDPYDKERFMMLRQLAAEIAATLTDSSPDFIHNLFNEEMDHATPKVVVRGAVFQDGKLLLVREAKSDSPSISYL